MGNGNFILKGNIIYSDSSTRLKVTENGYLVCIDGISKGVFKSLPAQYSGLPVTDYGTCMIIPGLVDLHAHAPQFPYRGTGMDLELMDWLEQNAFPEETRYSDLEYADKAYSLFADCMLRSATTRQVIFATRHSDATKVLMDKMEQTGLVTFVGKVNMDRLAPDALKEESAEVSAAETVRWLEETAGKYANTKPILTPRFIPSCTDELMKRLSEIRETYGLPVQSHLSENLGEIETVKELCPKSSFYGDVYESFGLFGSDHNCIMAHCVHSGDEEIELMKRNGVFVAHCPESNENIASGAAPIRKYLEKGLKVGLGSDIAGGASESIFHAMVQAIRVSKLRWRLMDQSLKPLTFPEAFYLGTVGGGSFFGKVGSFESGYEFDAVILTDEKQPFPRPLDPEKRLERFAYINGDLLGIKAKYVKGRKVL